MRPHLFLCLIPMLIVSGCNVLSDTNNTFVTSGIQSDTNADSQRLGYKHIGGGKYQLTQPMRFNTKRFGPVVLTSGFQSDGSSSPIPDTDSSRRAGFLHDALYAASGHLRFENGYPKSWSRKNADDEYCDLMKTFKVSETHRNTNCWGVKNLPTIESAWKRLTPKRKARWSKNSTL